MVFGPFLVDAYKIAHGSMYPDGTEIIFSNLTPRGDKYAPFPKDSPYYDRRITVFGIKAAIHHLMESWEEFFKTPKSDAMAILHDCFEGVFGEETIDLNPFADLHDLGYLPVAIRGLPEGSVVDLRIPILTIYNTDRRFPWVTNYLESFLSAEIWKPMTAATIASVLYRMCSHYARMTCDDDSHIPFQMHDFSMRGLSGATDSKVVGAAHLTCFRGTDSISAVDFIANHYLDRPFEDIKDLRKAIGNSVPASEHTVMMVGMAVESEKDVILRLLRKYPKGVLSLVMDTRDYWNVLENILDDPEVKAAVMARDGKLVVRPDSGDPLKIICGDDEAEVGSPEFMGSLGLLASIYGTTKNEKGYDVLDSHIGIIYGDSINYTRAEQIFKEMQYAGYASSNIVFGVGSFTYQYLTRDTFAVAVKATYCEINGRGCDLLKDPKTDDGTKKSASGLLSVTEADGRYTLNEKMSWGDVLSSKNAHVLYMQGRHRLSGTEADIFEIRERLKAINESIVDAT